MQQDIAKHKAAWDIAYESYVDQEAKSHAFDAESELMQLHYDIEWELERRLAAALELPLNKISKDEYELERERESESENGSIVQAPLAQSWSHYKNRIYSLVTLFFKRFNR